MAWGCMVLHISMCILVSQAQTTLSPSIMTPGQTYPAGYTEAVVSRPIRSFLPPNSNSLVTNVGLEKYQLTQQNNADIVFMGSRLVSQRMSQKLDLLSSYVATYFRLLVKSYFLTFFRNTMRLIVYSGYLPPPSNFAVSGNLSLQYEGRAVFMGFDYYHFICLPSDLHLFHPHRQLQRKLTLEHWADLLFLDTLIGLRCSTQLRFMSVLFPLVSLNAYRMLISQRAIMCWILSFFWMDLEVLD
jgi:hypothetical protein